MRMNRRNVLVGLGTIVAGGGAALGTGAFSSVEANRSVNVNLEGDASALVELSVNANDFEGVTEGEDADGLAIEIDFVNINDNSITAFDDVIEVGFSEAETSEESFTVDISTSHGGVAVYDGNFTDTDKSSIQNSAELGTMSDTDTVSGGIAVNTGVSDDDRFGSEVLSDEGQADITITATRE